MCTCKMNRDQKQTDLSVLNPFCKRSSLCRDVCKAVVGYTLGEPFSDRGSHAGVGRARGSSGWGNGQAAPTFVVSCIPVTHKKSEASTPSHLSIFPASKQPKRFSSCRTALAGVGLGSDIASEGEPWLGKSPVGQIERPGGPIGHFHLGWETSGWFPNQGGSDPQVSSGGLGTIRGLSDIRELCDCCAGTCPFLNFGCQQRQKPC